MSHPELLVLALPIMVVLSGCRDTPPTTPTGTSASGAPAAAIGSGQSQVDAITRLVDEANAAWAAKDATAYAAHYADDFVFINPIGGFSTGREAFRLTHVFLFNGPFAGSTQTISVRSIRFLTGTIAIVDQDVSLTGYAFLPPNGLRATEPGVVRTSVRWVVMKRGADWEIVAQQMTPIPPAP